jgi:hypothetical protein
LRYFSRNQLGGNSQLIALWKKKIKDIRIQEEIYQSERGKRDKSKKVILFGEEFSLHFQCLSNNMPDLE